MSRDRLAELNNPYNERPSNQDTAPRLPNVGRRNNYVPLESQNLFEGGDQSSYRPNNNPFETPSRPALQPSAASLRPPPQAATSPGRVEETYEMSQRPNLTPSSFSNPSSNIPPQPPSTLESKNVFFAEITTINNLVKKARDNVTNIEQLQDQSLNGDAFGGGGGRQNQLDKQLESLCEENRVLLEALKKRIRAIELENAKISLSHPDINMRKSQHGQVKRKFLDLISLYNDVERDFIKKVKIRMERGIRVVNPELTDMEVKELMENQMEGGLFAQSMISTGSRYAKASDALAEVRSRHRGMLKVEKTIIQLTEMFVEMSTLVEAQGQAVATIEENVGSTEQYTEQAVQELNVAVGTAKKVRGRKWQLLFCCVLLLLLLGLLVYFFWIKPTLPESQPNRTGGS